VTGNTSVQTSYTLKPKCFGLIIENYYYRMDVINLNFFIFFLKINNNRQVAAKAHPMGHGIAWNIC